MTRFRNTAPAFPVHGIDATPPVGLEGHFSLEQVRELGTLSLDNMPHRHDFTEFLFVTGGSGTHYVDFKAYPVEAPQIFLLAEGQVHHWGADASIDGILVLFREEFLHGPGGASPRALPIDFDGSPGLKPTDEQSRRVRRILDAMADECANAAETQSIALRSLLTVLLLECDRMSTQTSETVVSSLSKEFSQLVMSSVSARTTVEGCADRLGVTSGHLYDVIVAETGRTPGSIVRGALVREAKRMLAGSDLTCAQIARALEFSSASYFSRFFVREAGLTPSEYRDSVLAELSPAAITAA